MPNTVRTPARRKTAGRKPASPPLRRKAAGRRRTGPVTEHPVQENLSKETPLEEIPLKEVAAQEIPVEEVHPGHEFSDEYDITHTGEDDQIEDPVRIYLMQMGEIPLLTRSEEVSAAKRIARSRKRKRKAVTVLVI